MVISDFQGYSVYGSRPAYAQNPAVRPAVTLDAEPDPKTPHQYAVTSRLQVIPPPERPAEAKYASKKPNQNDDPVSRAFMAIADYQITTYHRIDIKV